MFDFLKRPKVIAKVPTANVEPERYKGRPLLVILEQYILHCIGEGKAKDDPNMVHIVQRVWGGGNDWPQTTREALHFPPRLDDAIRVLWVRNQEVARRNKDTFHPVQFAKMYVDAHFAGLLEK
jgi:hypothetical protein